MLTSIAFNSSYIKLKLKRLKNYKTTSLVHAALSVKLVVLFITVYFLYNMHQNVNHIIDFDKDLSLINKEVVKCESNNQQIKNKLDNLSR